MDEKDKEIQELKRKIAVLTGENAINDIIIDKLLSTFHDFAIETSKSCQKALGDLKEIYEDIERENKRKAR